MAIALPRLRRIGLEVPQLVKRVIDGVPEPHEHRLCDLLSDEDRARAQPLQHAAATNGQLRARRGPCDGPLTSSGCAARRAKLATATKAETHVYLTGGAPWSRQGGDHSERRSTNRAGTSLRFAGVAGAEDRLRSGACAGSASRVADAATSRRPASAVAPPSAAAPPVLPRRSSPGGYRPLYGRIA